MGAHLREGQQFLGGFAAPMIRLNSISPLISGPRRKKWASPLNGRLFYRRRGSQAQRLKKLQKPPSLGVSSVACKTTKPNSPVSPCNMYISNDFTVRLRQYFKLHRLVQDSDEKGLVQNVFSPVRDVKQMALSDPAKRIRDVPNAGGNSVVSEVLSFELLKRCFGAQLIKTEMEVSYFPEGGSITDYMCKMFNTDLGVSVTRAMKFNGHYTKEDAEKLLTKKLKGVIQSSRNALDKWSKQILHIWATSTEVARIVTESYWRLPCQVKSNTVVIVTVATSASEIFTNR